MALNPVGSGSSLTVSTDTAKVIANGIAQQSDTLKVTLVGASGLEGAHIKVGEMPTATTADFYLVKGETATLNIHRNGPYGWPIFKQTRIGQNPLTRYQNRNSIFTYVTEIGDIKLLIFWLF